MFPGVHQLKVPIPDNPLEYLNCYLLQGDRGWLMIDTGWSTESSFVSLQAQLSELGLSFLDISQIVITHVHADHYGLAGRIRQISPAKLALHHWEKALIESRYVHFAELQAGMGELLQVHGAPPAVAKELKVASEPVLGYVIVTWPDQVLYGVETISTGQFNLQVLWTPGHSPGHICLYEPEKKLLFSGDHILPVITSSVVYHLQSGTNPLGDFINSLKQLQHLPVNLVLPAHEHIFTNLSQRVDQMVQHHEERKKAILGTITAAPRTAYDISGLIPWNLPDTTWEQMPPLHRRLAMMETLAHLQYMWFDGQVEIVNRDHIILYKRAGKD
ncbi:MAG: MBL fold metallo-hydrolase [Dehalococcoidia bacterium]|nr:MBL fold metallo-hydrolase [Dehalococcoidia bacterium]